MMNISSDFETFCTNDFGLPVTLRVGDEDLFIAKSLSRTATVKELEPSGGYVYKQGQMFAWSRNRTDQPPLGSIVIDQYGTYWTVYQVAYVPNFHTWDVFTLNLGVVSADINTATLLKATYTHGRAGEAKATWNGLFSGVPDGNEEDTVSARFQPSMETAKIEFGSEYSGVVYRVLFDRAVPMQAAGGEYRIIDADGNRYRVWKYFNEQRIDKLPVAIAVRIIEGGQE